MKFAYADPPYYGQGKKRYGDHPQAAVYDSKEGHFALIDRLNTEYDGWALSCNTADLQWLLPYCPNDIRVAAWVKPFHQIRPTTIQFAWEPVIVRGWRINNKRKPMVRDWLSCVPSRGKKIIGAKPEQFNKWILDLLNYDSSADTLDDLFPGSGGMTQLVNN